MRIWARSIGAIIIIGVVIIFGYYLIMSGNSGFEQQYKFDVSKEVLIKVVEDFKVQNKQFIPIPKYEATDYLDTISTLFVAYIYYPKKDMIVCFTINNNPDYPDVSYLNLLSVNRGLNQPEFKLINRDFDRKENLEIKNEFREKFLNKLNLDYSDNGNGNFIFWK
jgi:hypothetical protein